MGRETAPTPVCEASDLARRRKPRVLRRHEGDMRKTINEYHPAAMTAPVRHKRDGTGDCRNPAAAGYLARTRCARGNRSSGVSSEAANGRFFGPRQLGPVGAICATFRGARAFSVFLWCHWALPSLNRLPRPPSGYARCYVSWWSRNPGESRFVAAHEVERKTGALTLAIINYEGGFPRPGGELILRSAREETNTPSPPRRTVVIS